MTDLTQFIEGMPKTELHLHIEGSLEPELMFGLAQRNGAALPYASVEEIETAYKRGGRFENLQDFLDVYYAGMSVLQTEQDFYDLTMAYLEKVAAQNVRHTEIFFDPQGHTGRGIEFDTALGGITRALDDAQEKLDMSSEVIMCFLRHLPEQHTEETREQFPGEDDAETTLDKLLASPLKDRVIGVGLDSSEVGHPPSKFTRVFARARQQGLIHNVAHICEEGPPEYGEEGLDDLKIVRGDHGNRILEDKALTARVAGEGIGLTICPLSNYKLCVVDDMTQHPLKTMLEKGLKATVNSDDPAYFDGYMNENYLAVVQALALTQADVITLARNAIDVSFAPEGRKNELHEELDKYVKAYKPGFKLVGCPPRPELY